MKTYRDFVETYWIVALALITILLFLLWFMATANSLGVIFPMGMVSYPWYLKQHRKKHLNVRRTVHHPFIYRILNIMMLEFIFNRNEIISLNMLKDNGISTGQLVYATTALKEKGVVERYNTRNIKLNFTAAKKVMSSEVFKGGATWT